MPHRDYNELQLPYQGGNSRGDVVADGVARGGRHRYDVRKGPITKDPNRTEVLAGADYALPAAAAVMASNIG